MISRKTTQISPRFIDFREPGGGAPCSTGTRPSGSDSEFLVAGIVESPIEKLKSKYTKYRNLM